MAEYDLLGHKRNEDIKHENKILPWYEKLQECKSNLFQCINRMEDYRSLSNSQIKEDKLNTWMKCC
jgi:hypothetical protein